MPSIKLIAALARNHVIGTANGMPWDVPEEYQQYLSLIRDKTVIMGRKTYEIFGKDLSSKRVFVVSRSMAQNGEYEVVDDLDKALMQAAAFPEDIMVAGGASIYAQSLPFANEMFLSYIKGHFSGIAYFPDFDQEDWDVVERVDHPRFEFVVYRRKPLPAS